MKLPKFIIAKKRKLRFVEKMAGRHGKQGYCSPNVRHGRHAIFGGWNTVEYRN